MAKPSITDASGITADVILEIGKFHSAQQLRSLQSKLSATASEIYNLSNGSNLPGRIGAHLSLEQRQLLGDAAKLIESIKSQLKHAKEKRSRVEEQAKRRKQAREADAKRLVAETYPLPGDSVEELLEIIKMVLTFNRAGVLLIGHPASSSEHNLKLREYLSPSYTRKLIGWTSTQAFWKSIVHSLRHDFLGSVEHEISYDDGSSVRERLDELSQKVTDCLARIYLTADEEKTLTLWSQALAPVGQEAGAQ